LRHEGKTILIVTHDTELIREVADDVIDFDQQVQRANKRKGAQ
jgi:ABC-type polar amino acid transport system ATPase subunit